MMVHPLTRCGTSRLNDAAVVYKFLLIAVLPR